MRSTQPTGAESVELRGLKDLELAAIWRSRYHGILTIWGWDGGYRLPRHVRARRALLARRLRRAKQRRG